MVSQGIDICVCIYIASIRYIIALRLQPVDKFVLIKEVMACPVAVARTKRTIKRDFRGVGSLKDAQICVVIIQTGTAPGIIRLVGGHAGLEIYGLVAAIIAHHKENKAGLAGGGSELRQVHPGNPTGGNVQRSGLGPIATGDDPGHLVWCRYSLVKAGKTALRTD